MFAGEYVTQNEAAVLKDVEYHTIMRWIRQGKLSADKIGGVVLIRRTDLTQIVKSNRGRPQVEVHE